MDEGGLPAAFLEALAHRGDIVTLLKNEANRAAEDNPLAQIVDFFDNGHDADVLVTTGAQEALYLAIQVLLSPGDAAIITDPYYGAYGPMTRVAGWEAWTALLDATEEVGGETDLGLHVLLAVAEVVVDDEREHDAFPGEGLEDAALVRAKRTAALQQAKEDLESAHEKLKSGFMNTIKVFSGLIELRDYVQECPQANSAAIGGFFVRRRREQEPPTQLVPAAPVGGAAGREEPRSVSTASRS